MFNITSSADVEAATSAFTSVPLSEWPSALQSQASVYPTGSFPPSNFTPSPINRPVIDSITFCANGQCSGGPDTDVTVPWADFALALPCAKAALNGSGPGFIFADGWLGSCELHWFASASCVDEIGWMAGAHHLAGCQIALNFSGNPIDAMQSFSYISPTWVSDDIPAADGK